LPDAPRLLWSVAGHPGTTHSLIGNVNARFYFFSAVEPYHHWQILVNKNEPIFCSAEQKQRLFLVLADERLFPAEYAELEGIFIMKPSGKSV
jgi:hypothetical protein